MNQSDFSTRVSGLVMMGPQTARRSFLGVLIGLIWTTIGGTMAGVAARFIGGPTVNSVSSTEWTVIDGSAESQDGQPIKGTVLVKLNSGWALLNSLRSVWIVKRAQKTTVYSATCPHLGCSVDASKAGFACPCHGSSWDLNGQKLGGPAPRDLDVLESRYEGDKLFVRYQDFKQGIPAKQPIS